MREDLADAQACADWAITQINVLRGHLIAWEKIPAYRIVAEPHAEPGKKVLRLRDVTPVHPLINAEVGAMINSIRSSLDVLVNRLAQRTGYAGKEDSHFPICRSRDEFFVGKHAGRKAIKRLSAVDQRVIEELEPWRGGKDPLIYALHDLDITRKHKRLVNVAVRPLFTTVENSVNGRGFWFPTATTVFENNAELGIVTVETDNDKFQFAFEVTLNEAGALASEGVTLAIQRLAATASHIIRLFDN